MAAPISGAPTLTTTASDHDRLGRRARYEAHPPQRGFRRALAGAIARAIAALLAGLAHVDAQLCCSGSLPRPRQVRVGRVSRRRQEDTQVGLGGDELAPLALPQ